MFSLFLNEWLRGQGAIVRESQLARSLSSSPVSSFRCAGAATSLDEMGPPRWMRRLLSTLPPSSQASN
jgi:hypothetical protein